MGPHDECVDDSRDGSKQYPPSQAKQDIPDPLIHAQPADAAIRNDTPCSMGTFTPPTEDGVPPTFPEGSPEWNANPLGNRLMSHYGTNFRPLKGRNVFIWTDGTVSEELPPATYDSNGKLTASSWDRVRKVFWGGHAGETVTAADEALLEAAGYTVTD